MKYLLLIYGNDQIWSSYSEAEEAKLIAQDGEFQREFRASGELLSAEGLEDAVQARVVRVRDGVPVVTDGPYLESKEYLASFYVLDCPSLDRALEIAARYPIARAQGVEVWPLLQAPDDTGAGPDGTGGTAGA